MAPRKSKKLERAGFTRVELELDPTTNDRHRMLPLRFYRGDGDWEALMLVFQQHAMDSRNGLGDLPLNDAGIVEDIRNRLHTHSEIMNIGKRPYSIPYIASDRRLRVDNESECRAVAALFEWLADLGGCRDFFAIIDALRNETVSFVIAYGYAEGKPVKQWDVPASSIGPAYDWAYGIECNEIIAKSLEQQAEWIRRRNIEKQQKEVA